MSISIYYTARREQPLSDDERSQIATIENKFSVDDQIEERERTGTGHNWESFYIYDSNDPTEPDVIFEGATKLPDNSEDATWIGLQHWCAALTAVRKVIPDADWHVHVDDHEIQWDDSLGEFDPTQ